MHLVSHPTKIPTLICLTVKPVIPRRALKQEGGLRAPVPAKYSLFSAELRNYVMLAMESSPKIIKKWKLKSHSLLVRSTIQVFRIFVQSPLFLIGLCPLEP